ncbi:MAG: hypothetical protein GY696_35380, partial [Gammaproteobacteria bacterium]|nr:hypothetical protein [Gammaproteobacteria bacterium]
MPQDNGDKKSATDEQKFRHLEWKNKTRTSENEPTEIPTRNSHIGKVVYNFSKKGLSLDERLGLEHGKNFAVMSNKLPKTEIQVACKDFGQKMVIANSRPPQTIILRENDAAPTPPFRPNSFYFPVNEDPNLSSCLQHFGHRVLDIVSTAKLPPRNLPREQRVALANLAQDESRLVLPADKGNALVVLDTAVYHRKMETDVLSDNTKFKPLKSDPTKTREKSLNKFLITLQKSEKITQRLYKFLRKSDARTPQLYGLPKVHKEGCPLRPIVSAIRSFNYNTGKLLVWFLTPYMSQCDSFIKNSTDFVNKIRSQKPGYSRQASFDVKSLFTNVPVKEAVDMAVELILNDDDSRCWLSGSDLQTLFTFATSFCNF